MARDLKTGAKIRIKNGRYVGQFGRVVRLLGTGRGRKWEVRLASGVVEPFAAKALESITTPDAPTVTTTISATANDAAETDSNSSSGGSAQSQDGSESDSSSAADDDGDVVARSAVESARFVWS